MTESIPYQAPPNGWRTFLIVWATQSVSVLGSALTFFAITIWLTTGLYPTAAQKPQLAWALSAVALSFAERADLGGEKDVSQCIPGAWVGLGSSGAAED